MSTVPELTYAFHAAANERYLDDRPRFRCGDTVRSSNQMADTTQRVANALRGRLGLSQQDRFAVLSLNSLEYINLWHAGLLGGGVINALNNRFAAPELAHVLRDSGTRVVFVDEAYAPVLDAAIRDIRDELAVEHVVLIGDPASGVPHDLTWDQLLADAEPVLPPPPAEEDWAVLMYTGGTTGLPKGVLTSHRQQMLNVYHGRLATPVAPGQRFLFQTPMFHANALGILLDIGNDVDTELVVLPTYDPVAVLDAIEEHQITMTTTVPVMLGLLLLQEEFAPERIQSMSTIIYGASPMPLGLLNIMQAILPECDFFQGYGATELTTLATILTPADHRAGGDLLRSAGRAVPGVNLAVFDDDGNELPIGEVGEVGVRGGNVMLGYWNNQEATDAAIRDGRYFTGDVGYLDERGYLYLVDRAKDMIVSGGENVYSAEVESAISTHPSVAMVAVIGVPDDTWGERVHAVVVALPGTELDEVELREHAKAQIANYKVPRTWEFRDELPLSGVGKPLKRELRKEFWGDADRAIN